MRDLVILGCGGFGREVADVVDAINRDSSTWNLLGFVDDDPTPENVARVNRRGSSVLGTFDTMAPRLHDTYFVVAIGSTAVRRRVADAAARTDLTPATLIHPWAAVGAGGHVGDGSIICAHVDVGSDVVLGRHVHVDRASQVGHDSVIEDFATVHPTAAISGECVIGEGVELGTNCTLLPGVSIGAAAVVAAAACVTKDVRAGATVRGVPAR